MDVSRFKQKLIILCRSGYYSIRYVIARRIKFSCQSIKSNIHIGPHDIADRVKHGIPFSQALENHCKIFDSLMIQMIAVGQKSGNLGACLEVLTNHLESLALCKSRLRAAVVLPAITLCFFMTIIAVMLIVVLPQIVSLFQSMHREIPTSTKIMVALTTHYTQLVTFAIPVIGLEFGG